MRKIVLFVAFAGALATASGTFAANTTPAPTTTTTTTVVIAPAQQTVLHDYVIKQKTTSVAIPNGFKLDVGAVLPANVQIAPLDVPSLKLTQNYDYVLLGGKTVIVDPTSRKIVQVIQ